MADPEALYVRVRAHGEQADYDRAFYVGKQVFIEALGTRFYWLMKDRCHLFLDPGATRRIYRLLRSGRKNSRSSSAISSARS